MTEALHYYEAFGETRDLIRAELVRGSAAAKKAQEIQEELGAKAETRLNF